MLRYPLLALLLAASGCIHVLQNPEERHGKHEVWLQTTSIISLLSWQPIGIYRCDTRARPNQTRCYPVEAR